MRKELLEMGLLLVMLLALRIPPVAGQDAAQSVRVRSIIADGWSSFYPGNARVDHSVAHSGRASGRITIVPGTGNGSSIYLIQALRPNAFREKRLKITGFIKTQDLVGGAALIFNVEGPNGQLLGRDQMDGHLIKGTTDWAEYQAVLDVPKAAQILVFGLEVQFDEDTRGTAWVDDVRVRVVGREVATTLPNNGLDNLATPRHFDPEQARALARLAVSAPTNLGFER